jgi:drug/metabolite transporter (DMT)-like permease
MTAGRRRAARIPPGVLLGLLGVTLFSFSFPATKLAVDGLSAGFVSMGRATVAGILSAAVLLAARVPWPTRAQWRSLAIVAVGVVLGFPFFTSLALEGETSAHAAVVTAVMPAATAVAAVLRAGERPSVAFWLASGAGMVAVLAFAFGQGAGAIGSADLFLLAAVALVGLGYAEGGALARDLGGAHTICWALILALPVTLPVAALSAATGDVSGPADAWLGFAYVSLVSMFLGFFAWYAGLARGGVAKIGQIQLAQPVMTLGWSAFLLSEPVGPGTIVTSLVVLVCVVVTQRTRVVPAAAD